MTTQQQYLRDAASLLGLTQKGLAERMTEGSEGHTVSEVQMTEAEFKALPEFEG